jgi:hypothetical protein
VDMSLPMNFILGARAQRSVQSCDQSEALWVQMEPQDIVYVFW